jgi:hypothetical protein
MFGYYFVMGVFILTVVASVAAMITNKKGK